jgi:hypothetical protein
MYISVEAGNVEHVLEQSTCGPIQVVQTDLRSISYRVHEGNLLQLSKGLKRLKFESCHKNVFVRRLRARS